MIEAEVRLFAVEEAFPETEELFVALFVAGFPAFVLEAGQTVEILLLAAAQIVGLQEAGRIVAAFVGIPLDWNTLPGPFALLPLPEASSRQHRALPVQARLAQTLPLLMTDPSFDPFLENTLASYR